MVWDPSDPKLVQARGNSVTNNSSTGETWKLKTQTRVLDLGESTGSIWWPGLQKLILELEISGAQGTVQGIGDLKEHIQLGQFQKSQQGTGKIAEDQSAAVGADILHKGHQSPQSRAIKIFGIGKVQDDLLRTILYMLSQAFPKFPSHHHINSWLQYMQNYSVIFLFGADHPVFQNLPVLRRSIVFPVPTFIAVGLGKKSSVLCSRISEI